MVTLMYARRLATSLALVLVACSAARAQSDPAAKGPNATRSQRYTITVQGSSTSIDIRLPAAASFARPVVVICHGWAYSIGNYESIAEHLASRGFAAVLYSQPNLFGTNTQTWASQMKDAISEVARLNGKTTSGVFGELDMNKVGLLGHSYGGACVSMLAGQDARVKTVVAMAPVNQWTWSSVISATAQIKSPFLVLAGSSDWLARESYTRPLYNAATRAPEKQYVEVSGAGHVFMIGSGSQAVLASRYYTSWLERFLMGKDDAAGWTNGTKAKQQEQQGVLSHSGHSVLGASSATPSTGTSAPASNLLQVGSTGQAVKDLQTKLKSLGFFSSAVDGDFGPLTEAAVKSFQNSKGLQADGVVGTLTRTALGL
ncbi:MAG: alpha/beta fold hydrolase [Planctomycetota bacterium]